MDYDAVSDYFDKADEVIDLHGHIIGMGLSPDHRYLYVHTGQWPSDYIISNPLQPPPIGQAINIHVIDLTTLKTVGTTFQSHKAYRPNDECYYFIFMDVCDNYLARLVVPINFNVLKSKTFFLAFSIVGQKTCMLTFGIDTMEFVWLKIVTRT